MAGDPVIDHAGDPVLEHLRREGLIRPGAPVVALISAGRDSSCLLHACVEVAGAGAVTGLHVNYGLREDAGRDERSCAELCLSLGVALELGFPRTPPAGNTQAWARGRRYELAAELAGRIGADVATGHTADDQVETILYRAISSPSRRAVLGMPVRSGRVVRPLLALGRAETTAYCTRHGIRWRDDPSNDSGAYVRNRIRHELLPLLRELHPAAESNLLSLAARLREEGDVLEELVERILGVTPSIELARLRELRPALARLVVQRLADDALGRPAAGAGRRAAELAALDRSGTVGLDIGCGLRAVSEYGVLRIERLGVPAAAPEPVALSVPGEVRFGETVVRCEMVAPAREPGVLDRDSLGEAVIVRGWRHGDRMRPLGLRGSASLQDLFTARSVPRARRTRVAIAESAGEIVWVDGIAIAERCKVTAETRRAVRLSAGAP